MSYGNFLWNANARWNQTFVSHIHYCLIPKPIFVSPTDVFTNMLFLFPMVVSTTLQHRCLSPERKVFFVALSNHGRWPNWARPITQPAARSVCLLFTKIKRNANGLPAILSLAGRIHVLRGIVYQVIKYRTNGLVSESAIPIFHWSELEMS